MKSLVVMPISQASTSNELGMLVVKDLEEYCLYTEQAYHNEMPPTSIPEIK